MIVTIKHYITNLGYDRHDIYLYSSLFQEERDACGIKRALLHWLLFQASVCHR